MDAEVRAKAGEANNVVDPCHLNIMGYFPNLFWNLRPDVAMVLLQMPLRKRREAKAKAGEANNVVERMTDEMKQAIWSKVGQKPLCYNAYHTTLGSRSGLSQVLADLSIAEFDFRRRGQFVAQVEIL